MAHSCRPQIRLLFGIQLALGILVLVEGLLIQPNSPHFQLDAVLTPEELRDDDIRTSTLEILERLNAVSNDQLAWTILGTAFAVTSAFGLYLARDEAPRAT